MSSNPLPDIKDLHQQLDQLAEFQWVEDNWSESIAAYGGAVQRRKGFFMKPEGDNSDIEQFTAGTYVSVHLPSDRHIPGEASASSIAKIIDVLEDQDGCCHVALHYFWRWGQIHAKADVDSSSSRSSSGSGVVRSRLTATRYAAELFLQAPKTRAEDDGGSDMLYYPDGTYREVLAAANVNHKVVVLPYSSVMKDYGSLQAYEESFMDPDNHVEVESGARKHGFFWRYLFDHTIYSFIDDLEAVVYESHKRLSLDQLTMGDIFCGAGTVALAARSAGWAVQLGVDADYHALNSFVANTAGAPEHPFNPPEYGETQAILGPVEQLLEGLQDGSVSVAPHSPEGSSRIVKEPHDGSLKLSRHISYLHLSPPCQQMSLRKELRLRTFTGTTLMAIPQMAELLQPEFITVEEVPGFIQQKFLKRNLNIPAPPAYKSAAQQQQRQPIRELNPEEVQQQQQQQEAEAQKEDTYGEDEGEAEEASDNQEEEEEEEEDEEEEEEEDGEVMFRPFQLVVPHLLSMGYQVRMCLLNGLEYGVPQDRWRVFLFAAKQGYQLPEPPTPRYAADVRRIFVGSVDPTFMPQGGHTASWFPPLTAITRAAVEALPLERNLLPHVILQEAIGDLPPIMSSNEGTSSSRVLRLTGKVHTGNNTGSNSNSRSFTNQQQQQYDPGDDPVPAGDEDPRARVSRLWHAGRAHLQHCQQLQQQHPLGPRRVLPPLGQETTDYRPENGVLLCQLPSGTVTDLHPVSAFVEFCRSPHWDGQEYSCSTFNEGCPIQGHCCKVSLAETLKALEAEEVHRMDPCGHVGTVLGHAEARGSCLHFAEPHLATLLEQRRKQGMPDWMHFCGPAKQQQQQVGNAVPYTLAAEVAASVWEAATGLPGQRPPDLCGPSPSGLGLRQEEMPAYHQWLQATVAEGGWDMVVDLCRKALKQRLAWRSSKEVSTEDEPTATTAAVTEVTAPSPDGSQEVPVHNMELDGSGGGGEGGRPGRGCSRFGSPSEVVSDLAAPTAAAGTTEVVADGSDSAQHAASDSVQQRQQLQASSSGFNRAATSGQPRQQQPDGRRSRKRLLQQANDAAAVDDDDAL